MRNTLSYIIICLSLAVSCNGGGAGVAYSKTGFAISLCQGMAPEAMRLVLYGSGSGQYSGDANLTGTVKGNVFNATTGLRTGNYDAFCYDINIPDTFVAVGKDKSELHFYTEQVSSDILARCGYDEGTSLHHTPDRVCSATFTNISVGSGANANSADAAFLSETWFVEVNGTGLQYAQAAGIVISGLPVTSHPYSADKDSCGDLWTELSIVGNQVRGTFNVFKGTGADRQSLVLNILDTEGRAYLFPFDCTGLMAQARRDGTMLICPEAYINIPEPEHTGSEGGFNPTLGEWGYETGEIII